MNIAFHTLGCKLNFSETSYIADEVQKFGYKQVDFNKNADIYVINTCTVTENANKECKYLVKKVLKKNPYAKTVVMGCYAQLKPKEIAQIEGVDLILGNNEKFKLKKYLEKLEKRQTAKIIRKKSNELDSFKSAFSFGNRTRSFLKVQDGCNYKCTFCTIPLARGKSRSNNIENVIRQIIKLKKDGIKEVVLTGINLGDFKTSQDEKLIDLLKEINKIDQIRVRISSVEPNLLNRKIINLIKNSKVLLPHFHIPLQSGSDEILKLMKRRYLTTHYQELINTINKTIPNACIGVDVIVGFPGESDEHFNETVNFIKSLKVSYLHVFSYSERENTEAKNMNGHIDVKKKKLRSQILRNLSDKKRQSFYQDNIGKTYNVLFENQDKHGYIYGFTENYIKIRSKYKPNMQNSLKKVKINKIEYNTLAYGTGQIINT